MTSTTDPTQPSSSGFLEDGLGPDAVDAVDGPGAGEVAVVGEGVAGGPASVAHGRGDGRPADLEDVAPEDADAFLDRSGDQPADEVLVADIGGFDHDGAGVLLAPGIDAVDSVGAGDSLAVDDGGPGFGTAGRDREDRDDEGGHDESRDPAHGPDGIQPRRLPRWTKVLMWIGGLLGGAALAFAILQPIKVLPRIRVAPGYALTDQAGESFTSESARGSVTLYSFAPLDCGSRCDEIFSTVAEVRERVETEVDLGEVEFRVVTIALADAPDPTALAAAAAASGADGEEWRWLGGPADRVRTVVGAGFRNFFEIEGDGAVEFEPGYALVDGNGVIRGEYRYRTVTDDADKIVSQLGSLGVELRHSGGAAGLAYEAAHLFSCYG